MYQGIYKCRVCGRTFTCGKKYTEAGAIEKIASVSTILVLSPNDLGYTAHCCKDGSYGIADLQGFKKVSD